MGRQFIRTNERIRAREVRVIDEEGTQLGIMSPFEALRKARELGLDLVEVAPTANPPVCRIINYGKFLYQLNKREHEARKHQRSAGLKEVKMRPRISQHDFEVKRNRVADFLQEGSKVKATIMFRGREMAHRELGRQLMDRLATELTETGQLETRPRQEGPNLSAIFSPVKKTSAKSPRAPKPAAASQKESAPVGPAAPVQEEKVAKAEAENA